MLNVLKKNKGF